MVPGKMCRLYPVIPEKVMYLIYFHVMYFLSLSGDTRDCNVFNFIMMMIAFIITLGEIM